MNPIIYSLAWSVPALILTVLIKLAFSETISPLDLVANFGIIFGAIAIARWRLKKSKR